MTASSKYELVTLDFNEFLNGDAIAQRKFSVKLVECFSNLGFVKLINHGLTDQQLIDIFDWNKKFFGMPLEAKNVAAHPPEPNPHRGYSYVGQEKLSRVKDFEKGSRELTEVFDVKESLDIGPVEDDLYPNRWPNEADIPGFRQSMETFYESCHSVHQDILRALAIGLDLEPDFLLNLCNNNTSELRLNHYPGGETSKIREGAKRISEHTDFGTITLLFQDNAGGLEIEAQDDPGRYFPIPPQNFNEMIINIGDCLARWTNDKFRSASHRVVFPENLPEWLDDRYSVAYFGKPNRTQPVGTLSQFTPVNEAPKYKDLSAWEYNQQKLLLTY